MADEIKIRVGVQSNVKAGMGNIIRDIRSQGEDMGRGFGAAFRQAASGNISGALNALFGGAVAGAALAGWQIGKKIDETFGISDKVANWWSAAAIQAGKSWDVFYKGLRAQREALDSVFTKTGIADDKVFDEKEKRAVKKMSPIDKAEYYEDGVKMAQAALDGYQKTFDSAFSEASKASPTKEIAEERADKLKAALQELEDRRMTLERMKSDYADAVSEQSKVHESAIKERYEADKKAEEDKKESLKRSAEFEKEMADMLLDQTKKNAEKKLDILNDAISRAENNLQDKRDMAEILSDPAKHKAYDKEQKDKAKKEARQEKIDAEMEGRVGRAKKREDGMPVDQYLRDWLESKQARQDAVMFEQELLDLQNQQLKAAQNIEKLLKDNLTMK